MVGAYFRYRSIIDIVSGVIVACAVIYGGSAGIVIFRQAQLDTLSAACGIIFQVSSSLLGFVLASVTFLSVHLKQAEYRILRQSKSYVALSLVFSSALWRLLALTVWSMGASLISREYLEIALAGMIFLSVISLNVVAALVWIVLRVLRVPTAN